LITLRGITWAHSRGYVPLVAASEAWHDVHANIEIQWDKRSFWGFGEGPLDEVARQYDLVVFDHTHTGTAARRRLFLPLDVAAGDCVGPSRESYHFEGCVYGLPIDAACQAAAYRPDLIDQPPQTWSDVIELARRTGGVRCAFSPMGALGMLHSLAAGLGTRGGSNPSQYFEPDAGLEALHRLQVLFDACGPASLEHSPVRILAEMACSKDAIYAPLLYCYSNYTRAGFAQHRIRFSPPAIANATLGGAGLAISAFTKHRDAAFRFAAWLISEQCQQGVYLYAQGQPALRSVWTNAGANQLTGGFFADLLPAIDKAYLRPNWPGYGEFQSRAAVIVHEFLKGVITARDALRSIDREFLCHG